MKKHTPSDIFSLRSFFILSFVVICFSDTIAELYFVDQNHKNAKDANPGSAKLPWMSLSRSINTVKAGDTVFIKEGTYREGQIKICQSGTSKEKMIYFHNFQNEYVIIIGGFELNNHDYLEFKGLHIKNGKYGFYENQGKGKSGSEFIYIKDCIVENTENQGIYIARGRSNSIQNCTIRNTGKHCIQSFGQFWTIENNDISNPGKEDGIHLTGDPGCHIVRNNYIHNINGIGHCDGIQLSSSAKTIIEYNIFENCRSTAIIMNDIAGTDNRCDSIIVRYNLIYQTKDFIEYNNTSYRIIASNGKGLQIIGNTICFAKLGALFFNDKAPYGHYGSGIVYNNIFFENRTVHAINKVTSFIFDYNCYYGSRQGTPSENQDYGKNSIFKNPHFISMDNSKRLGENYNEIINSNFLKLHTNSPLKDAGTRYLAKVKRSAKSWKAKDLAKLDIPQGKGFPIGCYEVPESSSLKKINLNLKNNYPSIFVKTVSSDGNLTFLFEIVKASPIVIDIINSKGIIIESLSTKVYQRGNHTLKWNLLPTTYNRLSTGVYYIKSTIDSYENTMSAVIVR